MKKYFIKGTDDELTTGDMIELDFTADMPNGNTRHHHVECKFLPPFIPFLLELGAIEEREVEDEVKRKVLDFCNEEDDCIIEQLLRMNENLEKRVEALESMAHVHNVPKHSKNAKKAC